MTPVLEVTDLTTVHPSAPGAVILPDGRTAEHFHHPENGSRFRVDGTFVPGLQIGENRNPKLHPELGVIWFGGNRLAATDLDTGDSQELHRFDGHAEVTMGNGEGVVLDHRWVPWRSETHVGVFDLVRGEVVFQHAARVTHGSVQPGPEGRYVVIRAANNNTRRIGADGSDITWTNEGSHCTIVKVGQEVWYIGTSDRMGASDRARWDLGGGGSIGWVYMVDIESQQKRGQFDHGWRCNHLAGLGSLLACSYEGGRPSRPTEVDVRDLATGEILLPKSLTGGDVTGFTSTAAYIRQAKQQLGENGKLYATVYPGTVSFTFTAPVPPPDPEEPMSDLDNRKDALDTASPPIPYTEEPFSVQAGTKLTIKEPDGNTVVEVYDDSGDLIRME